MVVEREGNGYSLQNLVRSRTNLQWKYENTMNFTLKNAFHTRKCAQNRLILLSCSSLSLLKKTPYIHVAIYYTIYIL